MQIEGRSKNKTIWVNTLDSQPLLLKMEGSIAFACSALHKFCKFVNLNLDDCQFWHVNLKAC